MSETFREGIGPEMVNAQERGLETLVAEEKREEAKGDLPEKMEGSKAPDSGVGPEEERESAPDCEDGEAASMPSEPSQQVESGFPLAEGEALSEELIAALKPFAKPKKRRIMVCDYDTLLHMLKKGFEVSSVLFHDSEGLRKQAAILKDICPSLPIQFFDKEEMAKALESMSKGRYITMADLRAMVEVPFLPCTQEVLSRYRKVLVLDRLENPKDIAKVIEVCHSFGVDALLVTKNTLNPYQGGISKMCHYKNLDMPIILAKNDPVARNRFLNKCGFVVFAMALSETAISFREMWSIQVPRYAITVGNEASGLAQESIDSSNYVVKIPMRNGVKSLNVAHACSIILYELSRVVLPPLEEEKGPEVVLDCEASETTDTSLEPNRQVESDVYEEHLQEGEALFPEEEAVEEPEFVRDRVASEISKSASEPSRQVETGFLEEEAYED